MNADCKGDTREVGKVCYSTSYIGEKPALLVLLNKFSEYKLQQQERKNPRQILRRILVTINVVTLFLSIYLHKACESRFVVIIGISYWLSIFGFSNTMLKMKPFFHNTKYKKEHLVKSDVIFRGSQIAFSTYSFDYHKVVKTYEVMRFPFPLEMPSLAKLRVPSEHLTF
uniref:Uncharacterized protein n=1 Tax=Glossina pallidipes TaxID=7398 RepID=A0A1A9ZUC2_GLOPL